MGETLVAPLPMPAGVPLDAASWDQTPLAVRQVIVQLLAVIQHQAARIAVLDARLSLTSRPSRLSWLKRVQTVGRRPRGNPWHFERPSRMMAQNDPTRLSHGVRQTTPRPPDTQEV